MSSIAPSIGSQLYIFVILYSWVNILPDFSSSIPSIETYVHKIGTYQCTFLLNALELVDLKWSFLRPSLTDSSTKTPVKSTFTQFSNWLQNKTPAKISFPPSWWADIQYYHFTLSAINSVSTFNTINSYFIEGQKIYSNTKTVVSRKKTKCAKWTNASEIMQTASAADVMLIKQLFQTLL